MGERKEEREREKRNNEEENSVTIRAVKNLPKIASFDLQGKGKRLVSVVSVSGGCIAQRKHYCFPPSSPRFKSQLRRDFVLFTA